MAHTETRILFRTMCYSCAGDNYDEQRVCVCVCVMNQKIACFMLNSDSDDANLDFVRFAMPAHNIYLLLFILLSV
jgi:hypothetical protein